MEEIWFQRFFLKLIRFKRILLERIYSKCFDRLILPGWLFAS